MSSGPNESAVNVRFYRPGDEEAMLRVFQAAFTPWPTIDIDVPPIDHLRWKIGGAPDPESAHAVAAATGQIVGARLCLVRDYFNNCERVAVRTDTDNAVLPEWRGRGVNTTISKFVVGTSPAEFVLSSTRQPSLVRRDQYLGHRPMRNRFISTSCPLHQGLPKASAAPISEVSRFDERIAHFWAQAVEPYEFIAAPSVAWLNWRFCDPRSSKGFVLQTEENGVVTGFIVARTSRGKGHIAYLLARPGRGDVTQALIAACMTHLRDAGVSDAICTLPKHHPYRDKLAEMGFTHKRRRVPVTTRIGRPQDRNARFVTIRVLACISSSETSTSSKENIMAEPHAIRLDTQDGVRIITFCRPGEYNTITPQLREELDTAIEQADADRDVRVMLLRAEGPAFCSGYGLDWATPGQAQEQQGERAWDSAADLQMIGGFVEDVPEALVRVVLQPDRREHGPALGDDARHALRWRRAPHAGRTGLRYALTRGRLPPSRPRTRRPFQRLRLRPKVEESHGSLKRPFV